VKSTEHLQFWKFLKFILIFYPRCIHVTWLNLNVILSDVSESFLSSQSRVRVTRPSSQSQRIFFRVES